MMDQPPNIYRAQGGAQWLPIKIPINSDKILFINEEYCGFFAVILRLNQLER